ncbi:MAG: hypothetical protein ACOZBH_04510 [Patescibacteria group bacterium]
MSIEDKDGYQDHNANLDEDDTSKNEDKLDEEEFEDDEDEEKSNEPDSSKKTEDKTSKKDLDAKTILAQKKRWREKAQKLEQELAEYRKKQDESEKAEDKTPKKINSETRLLRMELRQTFSDKQLTDEDIDKAVALSKVEGSSPEDVIKSPLFEAYLEKRAKKELREKATPSPSNRGGQAKHDFSDITPEKIRNMDEKEYAEYQKWRKSQDSGGRLRFIQD